MSRWNRGCFVPVLHDGEAVSIHIVLLGEGGEEFVHAFDLGLGDNLGAQIADRSGPHRRRTPWSRTRPSWIATAAAGRSRSRSTELVPTCHRIRSGLSASTSWSKRASMSEVVAVDAAIEHLDRMIGNNLVRSRRPTEPVAKSIARDRHAARNMDGHFGTSERNRRQLYCSTLSVTESHPYSAADHLAWDRWPFHADDFGARCHLSHRYKYGSRNPTM